MGTLDGTRKTPKSFIFERCYEFRQTDGKMGEELARFAFLGPFGTECTVRSANRHHLCDTPRKSGCSAHWSDYLRRARDYNGYRKAGLNPAEWAYEWSPFSVIIGALSTAQCRARNWHAKIGCDPIVGHCPIQATTRVAPSHFPPRQPSPVSPRSSPGFRIFRRRFSRFLSISQRQ